METWCSAKAGLSAASTTTTSRRSGKIWAEAGTSQWFDCPASTFRLENMVQVEQVLSPM